MGYAGRLDPMAEGVLLCLVGEENKKIGQYMGLDKEYKAEILIGLKSDSNDVLGIVEKGDLKIDFDEEKIKEIKKKLKSMRGEYHQKIPNYSSYRIKGKPMFYYALRGEEVKEVKKTVAIKKIKINSIYELGCGKLLRYVLKKIDLVDGNFRQEETKLKWKKVLNNCEVVEKFLVINVNFECSSGTYIRAIAEDIGKGYGGGLLFSLKRERVGEYNVRKSEKLR
jgi:tRNA pseudouridine55 synthase